MGKLIVDNLNGIIGAPEKGSKKSRPMPTAGEISSFRVIGSRVLVYPIDAASVSGGGIIVPELEQDNTIECPKMGVVMLSGEKLDLKYGDFVYYSQFVGSYVKHRGIVFRCLNEDDIFLVDSDFSGYDSTTGEKLP
jgi:co-chaperonin GroES (HSP10)